MVVIEQVNQEEVEVDNGEEDNTRKRLAKKRRVDGDQD